MKRIILSVLILLLASCRVWSQYRAFELELSMGIPFGMVAPKGGVNNGAASLALELRYNIPKVPLSAGCQFYFSGWGFDLPDSKDETYNNQVTILTIDYNFDKVHRSLRPFAGLGIGSGNVSSSTTAYLAVGRSDAAAYFTPRVGIEAWSRLRFTFAYHVTARSNSSFVCMLGFVVGGGRK